mmetsp:Transcript_7105/g.8540  ORF Transcript_7105/g.8540 Transcript_7105/m.8540 type:complete len:196 (+) Transcript_7105:58-645(+)
MLFNIVLFTFLASTTSFQSIKQTQVVRTKLHASSNTRPTLSAEQENFLFKRGFIYDESRGVFTKKAENRKSPIRPAIVRSSSRVLEVRFEKTATEKTVQAGHLAAETLKKALKKNAAKNFMHDEQSLRSELESIGHIFASHPKFGGIFVLLLQISAWLAIHNVLNENIHTLSSSVFSDKPFAIILGLASCIILCW